MSILINKIKQVIVGELKQLTDQELNVIVERPRQESNGHFSTNVALNAAKTLKTNPMEFANKLADILSKNDMFEAVNVANPGFINFILKPKVFNEILMKVLNEKEKFGSLEKKNFKYNLELVSANPTGYLHVGHARNGAIGDSVARILRFAGYDVETEYYTNDAGNQINIAAVTLFYHYKKLLGEEIEAPEEMYGGDMYIDIAKQFVDDLGDKYKDLTFAENKISDPEVHELFREKSVELFMKAIKQQLIDFGVNIQVYSSEKAMYEQHEIERVLKVYEEKGKTFKQDEALWLRTTEFGDDKDRVLVKSNGDYTYITPDLACHDMRMAASKADKYVNFWGGDHHGYIVRIRAGLALLGYPFDSLDIDMIQMVRLIKDGEEYKMSKRKGTAVWLIDLLEMVGKDATRYMLVSKNPSSHMDFDLDLAVQKNSSNPVYYAQYATARCNKIMKMAEENGVVLISDKFDKLTNEKEMQLQLQLDSFVDIIAYAAESRLPNVVCDYVQSLAKSFHSYYSDVKIVNSEDKELSGQRLALVQAIYQTLSNAFNLIGIDVKDSM